jgi:pimeloyl-ACP methyl ester carboxylesterase
MREALSVDIDGLRLHGTRHVGPIPKRRGIVFFNSGAQPRSSRGDFYVQLADGLAETGFVCFRFDMPGLGDSDGELPARHVDLYQLIQEGGHAKCAANLTQVLLETHKLDEVVLLGICGGAMTSIFAVPMLSGRVSGLVLLDLPFFSVRPRTPGDAREQSPSGIAKHHHRLAQWKATIHDRILASRWEPQVTAFYHKLKRVGKAVLPQRLPADANVKLLEVLSSLLNARIPALLISARPTQQMTPAFDYLAHLRRRYPKGWEHVEIPGTTHSFVENGGCRAVLETVLKWLSGQASPERGAQPAALDPAPTTGASFSPKYASAGSK